VVFGLDKISDDIEDVVLVEGELDVIALAMIGIPAVSTGSAHLSDTQQRLVRDYCYSIVVFYDTDTAGQNATWGYWSKSDEEWKPGVVEKLQPYMTVRVVEDHDDDASAMIQAGRERALRRLIERAPNSLSNML
jgi:hypothetical protein